MTEKLAVNTSINTSAAAADHNSIYMLVKTHFGIKTSHFQSLSIAVESIKLN